MLKRLTFLSALVLLLALAFPLNAVASRTIDGRISAYSPTSVSVFDKEVVTFAIDARTTYTKLITQKPWQEDTALNAGALSVGRYVVIHPRSDAANVAGWIQIATDLRNPLARPPSRPLTYDYEPWVSIAGLVEVPPPSELSELVAGAKTRDDHVRLARYFGAIAVKNQAAALEHLASAAEYRRSPNASESKRPGSPGTAAHCERLAKEAFEAARVANERSLEHELRVAAYR